MTVISPKAALDAPADPDASGNSYPYPPRYSETYVPATMPRIIGTFDMTAAFAVGLSLLPGAVITATVGVAGLSYLMLGGLVFFLPCLLITAQLARMLPHEGSLYNRTHRIVGPFWGFFVSICFWL